MTDPTLEDRLRSPEHKTAEPPARTAGLGVALLAAAMTLPLSEAARADEAPDRGLVSLRHLSYQDSQPEASRIHVNANAFMLMAPINGEWSVSFTRTADVISGASPAYHTSGLKKMEDRRDAVDADITRYFPHGTLGVGVSVSSESDYLSRGLSLQASHSGDDKNTTLTAGIGLTSDRINPNNHVVSGEEKHVVDVLLGITQVLTPRDIVQMNVGISSGHGYYSDPYKVFDRRPREHSNFTLVGRWNHHVESTQGTVHLQYRYYSDSWHINAHTLESEYVQPLDHGWTVTPLLRLYSQSAAGFYVPANPTPSPFPPNPPPGAAYFSEDQRVSAFGAVTVGLKVAKQLDADWTADWKYERYAQHSGWNLSGAGSRGLAAFNFRSIQFGLSRQF